MDYAFLMCNKLTKALKIEEYNILNMQKSCMALCIMKNYRIYMYAKKLFYFPFNCFWYVTYLKNHGNANICYLDQEKW